MIILMSLLASIGTLIGIGLGIIGIVTMLDFITKYPEPFIFIIFCAIVLFYLTSLFIHWYRYFKGKFQ
jgi:hypothetical protein